MSFTKIKNKMKALWISYVEYGDDSYNEFWHALRTLKNVDMLPYETWKKVVEYDHWLFEHITNSEDIMKERKAL